MELIIFNAQINILAVVAGMVANIVVGMIYFNPKVVGTYWMKLTGRTMDPAKGAVPTDYLYSMLAGFVTSLVMAVFISYALMSSMFISLAKSFLSESDELGKIVLSGAWSEIATAIIVAVMVWAGFVMTSAANEVIWEKRSFKLYLVTGVHLLISLVTIALVIVVITDFDVATAGL